MFEDLPMVPGFASNPETPDTLTGKICLNGEVVLDGLLCTPFTPNQVQSLINMRLG